MVGPLLLLLGRRVVGSGVLVRGWGVGRRGVFGGHFWGRGGEMGGMEVVVVVVVIGVEGGRVEGAGWGFGDVGLERGGGRGRSEC